MSDKPRILIWGASGHGKVVADIIRAAGEYELVGFVDDDASRRGSTVAGAPICGGREQLGRLRADGVEAIAFGVGVNPARLRLAAIAGEHGFQTPPIVHPRATVSPAASIAGGSVVMAGAVVNPEASIGRWAVVNTGAIVEHDCCVGEGASVCPGAVLGGRVEVGAGAWIGIGAVVRENVRIGAGAIVGAGAVVIADVEDRAMVYGAPARFVRRVEAGEIPLAPKRTASDAEDDSQTPDPARKGDALTPDNALREKS